MLLDTILGMSAAEPRTPAPEDDYWYEPVSPASATGMRVSADTAMRVTAVYRCVAILSQTIAALPLHFFRQQPGGGKEPADDLPLATVLRSRPNAWQTSYEYRQMMMGHLCLRGNAYSLILPGRTGAVDQLIPWHPDHVRVEQLASMRLRYWHRDPRSGVEKPYVQDEVFHLRGLTSDGVRGLNPIEHHRETVGLALATEKHGAAFFGNSMQPSGVLETDHQLGEEAIANLRTQLRERQVGIRNAGTPLVLQRGLKWHQVGLSNADAQYLQTRAFQIEEIARMFGVPLFLLGLTEKSTTWGSGVEQIGIGFVKYTLMPWLKLWREAISRDLISEPDAYYAEISAAGLMEGDSKARSEFFGKALGSNNGPGWMTVNEVRRKEGLNDVPGGDQLYQPPQGAGGNPPADDPAPTDEPTGDQE